MSTGFLALLDDVVALTKLAATSLDDVGAQTAKQVGKAGGKAAGIVIDDAAVTPRYVVGLAAERELPVIRKIALGSLKNKLLILLPGALILSFLAPRAITPLLMAGGAFLCLEGYHKVRDLIRPEQPSRSEAAASAPRTAEALEKERVHGAIRTDFVLSAEIMAITLASVATVQLWLQGVVLAVVGIGMTLLVYGLVAIIVKTDDFGLALARSRQRVISLIGRSIVRGTPVFLKGLSFVGMIAMLWVGGGILIHGLHELGVHGPESWIHRVATAVAGAVPAFSSLFNWLVAAGIAAVVGVIAGALVEPLERVIRSLKRKS